MEEQKQYSALPIARLFGVLCFFQSFDNLLRGHHLVGQEFKVSESRLIRCVARCCSGVSYDDHIKAIFNRISSV